MPRLDDTLLKDIITEETNEPGDPAHPIIES